MTEVYTQSGEEIGPLNILRDVFLTTQSPNKLENAVNDPTFFIRGENNVSMPAIVFQPAFYADVYRDGVSLPATAPLCGMKRKLVENPENYGQLGSDYAWKVAVLHPIFSKTISMHDKVVKTEKATLSIETRLTSDGQPTIQLTPPLDQFTQAIGHTGCPLSINPNAKYQLMTYTVTMSWITVGTLWLTTLNVMVAVLLFLFPSGTKEYAKGGPFYFRFGNYAER